MSALNHLFRRGAVYYWRRRLPRAVADIAGRTHACCSLKTREPRRARILALRLSWMFEEAMQREQAKIADGRAPTREDIDLILRDVYDAVTLDCENWAASAPCSLDPNFEPDPHEWITDEDWLEFLHRIPSTQAELWEERLSFHDHDLGARLLQSLLAKRGLYLDPSSLEFRRLARRAMRIGIGAFRRFAGETSEENIARELDQVLQRMTPVAEKQTTEQATPALPRISEKFEQWRQTMTGSNWKSKDARDSRVALDLFAGLMGDLRLDEINEETAWAFREKLREVPAMRDKHRHLMKLTPSAAIARANAIRDGEYVPEGADRPIKAEEMKRLSLKTQNKHLSYFTGFYKWKLLKPLNLGNPFEGTLHPKKAVEANKGRVRFEDDELVALFNTPIWTGCHPRFRPKKGRAIIRDAKFWAPIVSLYTSARSEEVLQAAPTDVRLLRGVWCFCITNTDDEGSVKSAAGHRYVPIHSELVRLGFLEYAEQMRRAKQKQLFPEVKRGGPERRFTYGYSKDFTRYRQSCGIYQKGKDHHSFRYNFDTALQNADVKSNVIGYLMGHKPQGMTDGIYHFGKMFGGFEVDVLVRAIEKLNFPGLTFKRLYVDSTSPPAISAAS